MKQQHIEQNLGSTTTTKQTSMLGLYAMNGGEGHLSYAQNSSYQRGVLDVAKPLLEEEIAAKLDHFNPNFRIADFGCSTGHNSFPAIEIITEAIEKKFETLRPEFQVFFNDQVMNDFNTLFHSLPQRKRNLYAAGVAGPFHGRLFPKASLDFAYSSCALNWLSQVPEAVADHTSPAWNKGRVHYTGAKHQVFEAYSNHYANDINSFLQARAEELVTGGLMALLVPADPAPRCSHGSATSFTTPTEIDLLGSCLVDMANKGIVSEERVDSFNFPLYFTIPEELKGIIERNMSFKIERMEIVNNIWGKGRLCSAKARAAYLRAVFEGMLINQFGREVMDQLFDRYTNKLAASPHFLDPHNEKSIIIFLLLKRN
ncbi:S-adenosyl-L-methionine-dependent methyltransferases superfamily protein [Perilla frutescens var. hirtella]|nr:S-adenosyl-L-methionine-dependent methyltransferases superfamily protein [Perilla frutescens var. hirtella]